MNFVWDQRKNRANLARHGIAFEDAIRIFEGPTLEKVDDRFDYGESRVYTDGSAGSFRHGGQSAMKEKPTGKTLAKGRTTDWKRLHALSDKDIRAAVKTDPEARPTDVDFWKQAKIMLPQAKQTMTIRLDADLLGWLRQQKGYQTRINAVLRTYMEAQKP